MNAVKVHKIVEEINQNNADIEMFNNAIDNGITGAQVIIQGTNGVYHSTIYRENRINLLLQSLHEENAKLMQQIKEL